jgi:hypothetical protein
LEGLADLNPHKVASLASKDRPTNVAGPSTAQTTVVAQTTLTGPPVSLTMTGSQNLVKGCRVQIVKEPSSLRGATAVITDANWHGLIVVRMDGDGETQSYYADELLLLETDTSYDGSCLGQGGFERLASEANSVAAVSSDGTASVRPSRQGSGMIGCASTVHDDLAPDRLEGKFSDLDEDGCDPVDHNLSLLEEEPSGVRQAQSQPSPTTPIGFGTFAKGLSLSVSRVDSIMRKTTTKKQVKFDGDKDTTPMLSMDIEDIHDILKGLENESNPKINDATTCVRKAPRKNTPFEKKLVIQTVEEDDVLSQISGDNEDNAHERESEDFDVIGVPSSRNFSKRLSPSPSGSGITSPMFASGTTGSTPAQRKTAQGARRDRSTSAVRRYRDLRSEIKKMRDALFTSCSSAFAPEVWNQCGVDDDHRMNQHQFNKDLANVFADLRRKNSRLDPGDGTEIQATEDEHEQAVQKASTRHSGKKISVLRARPASTSKRRRASSINDSHDSIAR